MKKVLKKRILIIIFMVIAIWGMNANKGVKADYEFIEKNKTTTAFGSISTEKIYEKSPGSGGRTTHLKLVFKKDFMSNYGGNYHGIQLRFRISGGDYTLANPSTVRLAEEGTDGWRFQYGGSGGSGYTYLFEVEDDGSLGKDTAEDVTLILEFDSSNSSGNYTPGRNVIFEISSIKCYALNEGGASKEDNSTYTVKAEIEAFPQLTSKSNIKVTGDTIRVKTGTNEGISTWTSLIEKLQMPEQYKSKKYYSIDTGTALNAGDDVCTGNMELTLDNGQTRMITVYVLGDCYHGSGSAEDRKINLSDVMAQRTFVVSGRPDYNGYWIYYNVADVDFTPGGVDVSDIIRTRKRITDTTWPDRETLGAGVDI